MTKAEPDAKLSPGFDGLPAAGCSVANPKLGLNNGMETDLRSVPQCMSVLVQRFSARFRRSITSPSLPALDAWRDEHVLPIDP